MCCHPAPWSRTLWPPSSESQDASPSIKGKTNAPGFVLDILGPWSYRGWSSAHLGDRDLPLVAIADSWLPASLPDPPASRIVVASLFIGWALASAGDVWPMAMQGVVLLWMHIYIYIDGLKLRMRARFPKIPFS